MTEEIPIFKLHTNLGVMKWGGEALIHAMRLGQQPNFAGTLDEVVEQYRKLKEWQKWPPLTDEEEKKIREHYSKSD